MGAMLGIQHREGLMAKEFYRPGSIYDIWVDNNNNITEDAAYPGW